ncbi:hypothetical protein SAQ01S_12300 [Sphingomonas aquatilis NBRC 16722]|nr:hypothetical protein SAQ01S_12300 [Sphingomonas aquatilis NBRC 16722]
MGRVVTFDHPRKDRLLEWDEVDERCNPGIHGVEPTFYLALAFFDAHVAASERGNFSP